MLDVVRPEARVRPAAHSRRWNWGIVDGIIGVILLPFGVWVLAIDRLVAVVAWLFNRD